ncbi:hypothetical protein [Algoriphagus resistens]|uniref:hypothetical protein n=1 Tax=Algoriphagus resistens TaxID=1750590 RepID=UPI000716AC43|nr:hypothetical protein [Algoriphagus resistens]
MNLRRTDNRRHNFGIPLLPSSFGRAYFFDTLMDSTFYQSERKSKDLLNLNNNTIDGSFTSLWILELVGIVNSNPIWSLVPVYEKMGWQLTTSFLKIQVYLFEGKIITHIFNTK